MPRLGRYKALRASQTSHNKTKMKLHQKIMLLGVGMAAASSSAMAAFTFTNGDLILGFQATAGVGTGKNVYFNLGSGTGLRDNGGQGLLGNISTALSDAYGPTWYNRTDVYFGVIGNLSSTGSAAVNGDPGRTFYVSRAAATPGSSTQIASTGNTAYTAANLATAGGLVTSMETSFTLSLAQTAGNTLTLDQTLNAGAAWNNGWTSRNVGGTGTAFGLFAGGIQQDFGKVGSTTYLDVQRILATTTLAVPSGPLGKGSYEFTVGIGSDGSITAIPEVSSTLLVSMVGLGFVFQRRRK
jgi:hypothetical protein